MKRPLYLVRYLRMERQLTDSWITFVLPYKMDMSVAADWAEAAMPGWEVVSGALHDPDDDEDSEGW